MALWKSRASCGQKFANLCLSTFSEQELQTFAPFFDIKCWRWILFPTTWLSLRPCRNICPLFAGHRPKPHSEAALHSAAGSGNAFSKEQLDRYTGAHLCDLSAFPSGKRFRVLHFQCNTRFLRTGKRTTHGTYPQWIFQAQPYSA